MQRSAHISRVRRRNALQFRESHLGLGLAVLWIMALSSHPIQLWFRRLLESAGVGALSSLVDFASLFVLVNAFHVPPVGANIPALLLGLVVQFIGARHVVFRDSKVTLKMQLVGFLVTELGAFLLNALLFHAFVAGLHMPYLMARLIGSFVVFVSFSFPMWNFVFRPSPR